MKNLVTEKMEKDLMPNLRENIIEDFYLTPDYFEKDLATLHGSGFSIQPKFSQSAYFRFHNQSEIFKNLFFVGAGTHPGAGMPGVLSSAKVLDKLFYPKLLQRKEHLEPQHQDEFRHLQSKAHRKFPIYYEI